MLNKISLPQITNPSGFVIYEGKSLIDGKPIVAIATINSENVKTGNMIQVWILRRYINPIAASMNGGDKSVCGDCIHRGDGKGKMRSCYVNLGQAPTNIYRKYKQKGYPKIVDFRIFKNRFVRIGAYGDPAALPYSVLEQMAKTASGWTGYTHQWLDCDFKYANLLMASVDNLNEFHLARTMGWRTFRVKSNDDPLVFREEFICPASPEGGNKRQCISCGACNGTKFGRVKRGNVVINVHGNKSKLHSWNRRIAEERV